ncbi:hypothetical protein LJB42_001936 [Komagataella kurtzmanii]|nr:hypothetical protein LJB42_001936 [Komagataella kurtzmanii]
MSSSQNTVVVLIGGGHKSGKSTASKRLEEELKLRTTKSFEINIKIIDFDSYLVDPEAKFLVTKEIGDWDKDQSLPSRFDFERLLEEVTEIKQKQGREAVHVLLIHGIYALYDSRITNLADVKVFIDLDSDTRLQRWIQDVVLSSDYDRELQGIYLDNLLNYYLKYARVEMSEFVSPTKASADIILPNGATTYGNSLITDGIIPLLRSSQDPLATSSYYRDSINLRTQQKDSFGIPLVSLDTDNADPQYGNMS